MNNNSDTSLFGGSPIIIALAFAALVLIANWKVFTKAGRRGWASIIPIYNTYVLLKIAKRPGWWLLLYIVPVVNIIVHLIVSMDIAKAFGKDSAFGVFALWLFPFIGYPILGFGDAKYRR